MGNLNSNESSSWDYAQGGLATSVNAGSIQFSTSPSSVTASVSATARSVELKKGWVGQIVVSNKIVWESKRTWSTKAKALTKTQDRILAKFSSVFS